MIPYMLLNVKLLVLVVALVVAYVALRHRLPFLSFSAIKGTLDLVCHVP